VSGIYSQPVQHPGQPENAMRARAGLRPLCFNRPDFAEAYSARDGWMYREIPAAMPKDCKAWAVHPQEDPAAESIPGRESWRCLGCRHIPQDPRVIARAEKAEAV